MRRPVPADRLAGLLRDDRGLSPAEVEERRARYGSNHVIEAPSRGWQDVLRDTIKDPMIWFLTGTSALFSFVGDYGEAVIMLAAIAPLVGMDAFLHRRTQASTQGLSSRLAERSTVIRDGVRIEISAADLVPGDLAIVAAGQPFPADGLVVAGADLQADESSLTGEAFPVQKSMISEALPSSGKPLIDSVHWVFAGTQLLTGEAQLRIAHTGPETLYGEIVRSAIQGSHTRTPLQQSISNLVAGLLAIAVALCLVLAWIRFKQGHGLVDALLSAVTLAVAAIPEEFPIVFTFFLGVGIYRLAKRQALVRRAVVVENIGRVSCICSDKTGTLTEGQIRVAHRIPAEGTDAHQLLEVAAWASRAENGDPLDAAILEIAAQEQTEFERLATYPFTADRRRETGVIRTRGGDTIAASKGAPEAILSRCRMTEAEQALWRDRVRELADTGHKVIACARRTFTDGTWQGTEPERDYRFSGLLACEDPVREGVVEAVRQAKDAGIRVVMVTGDHPITAGAIARDVGIGGARPNTIEGDELESIIARDGSRALLQVDVVARAVPAQKLLLVRTLQSQREIVAVTGDGVNDVPALQAADIGIAMGERGTTSAREVGAIVLLDDNFRTIVSAIREGRQLFRNLRLSFAYLLMIHIPLVATATMIPLGGYPLLYLPIHIVWLELIIHPTALLAFQELATGSRLAPARRSERAGQFFSKREWLVVGTVGGVVTLAILWAYDRSLVSGGPEHARALALAVLVSAGAAITAGLSGLRTRAATVMSAISVVSAIIFVQLPIIAGPLHLEALQINDWAIAAVGGLVPGALAALFRWGGSTFEPITNTPGSSG